MANGIKIDLATFEELPVEKQRSAQFQAIVGIHERLDKQRDRIDICERDILPIKRTYKYMISGLYAAVLGIFKTTFS